MENLDKEEMILARQKILAGLSRMTSPRKARINIKYITEITHETKVEKRDDGLTIPDFREALSK